MVEMLSNDERGWVLTIFSGIACVLGSSIICFDLLCRNIPGWDNFNIRESKTFLAASMSLSFGVMFFSALYGLLPEAREIFQRSGMRPDLATFTIVGCFLFGAAGLQVVSELLHRCLPSSIVNCDEHGKELSKSREARLEEGNEYNQPEASTSVVNEVTPLLDRQPSLKRTLSLALRGGTQLCDANGKCYGYQDHFCKQRCSIKPTPDVADITECSSDSSGVNLPPPSDLLHQGDEESAVEESHAERKNVPSSKSIRHQHHHHHHHHRGHGHDHTHTPSHSGHHHVAHNKFLSIGVQTSIAIALHKVPEGFITYATNHANPELGFSVFLAIFIHNIAEGFAMSLPLFLALKSRLKAIIWASLFGGLAQPIGAGLAMLTIRDKIGEEEGAGSGYIFAVTAGIMCSVGLQLFCQAVHVHHDSRLPLFFGFLGMGLLGLSFALTGSHEA